LFLSLSFSFFDATIHSCMSSPHHHQHRLLPLIHLLLLSSDPNTTRLKTNLSLSLSLSLSYNSHCLKTKVDAKCFQPSSNQPPSHAHSTTPPGNNHNTASNVKVAESLRRR
ncbi:hypothetical protein PanWU01x14_005890, partial [Parasponia andersonii]